MNLRSTATYDYSIPVCISTPQTTLSMPRFAVSGDFLGNIGGELDYGVMNEDAEGGEKIERPLTPASKSSLNTLESRSGIYVTTTTEVSRSVLIQ